MYITAIFFISLMAPPGVVTEAEPKLVEQCNAGDRPKCVDALEDLNKRRVEAISKHQYARQRRLDAEIAALEATLSRLPTSGASTATPPGASAPGLATANAQPDKPKQATWDELILSYQGGIRCSTARVGAAAGAAAADDCGDTRQSATTDIEDRQTHGVGGAAVSEGVAEALTLVADIAVKRAKQRGLAVLQARVRDATCNLAFGVGPSPTKDSEKVLPETCSLLSNTTIDKLVGDPRPLQIALFSDLLTTTARRFLQDRFIRLLPKDEYNVTSNKNLERLVWTTLKTCSRVITRKQSKFFTHDVEALLELMMSSGGTDLARRIYWKHARGVPLGISAAALFVSSVNVERHASPAEIIEQLAKNNDEYTAEDLATALEIVDLVSLAFTASLGEGEPDNPERVRAVVGLFFRVLGEYVDKNELDAKLGDEIRQLRIMILAALDQDVATALSAASRLLISELPLPTPTLENADNSNKSQEATKKRRAVEKTVALLTGVAAYADTYVKRTESDAPAPSPEQVRQARREALENLIDATTVRANRHGDWVVSLGLPVGFTGGLQWTREPRTEPDGSNVYTFSGNRGVMAPQLTFPLGIAVQRLVGRRYREGRVYRGGDTLKRRGFADGLHFFASAIDLGQFLGYDASGKINRPRWDSFISPGVQLGWIVGSPTNSFLIALDARYAPTLFAGTSKLTVPPDTSPGGAFRVGLTLAYYIPLFDFN